MQVDGRVLQLLVLEQIIESLLLRHAAPPAVLDRQLAYPSDTTEEALCVTELHAGGVPSHDRSDTPDPPAFEVPLPPD